MNASKLRRVGLVVAVDRHEHSRVLGALQFAHVERRLVGIDNAPGLLAQNLGRTPPCESFVRMNERE